VSIRIAVLNRHPKADWIANLDILDFGERYPPDPLPRDIADSWTCADVASVEVHELYHDDLAAVVSARGISPTTCKPTIDMLCRNAEFLGQPE
jgi:hypothetical protein